MQQSGRMGFRIVIGVPRPDAELVEEFRRIASSNLADAMGRFGFMDSGIRRRCGRGLCGVAVTVNNRPADNPRSSSPIRPLRALESEPPGGLLDCQQVVALAAHGLSRSSGVA